MEEAWKVNKSVLDSVHGRIMIPVSLCRNIIDTPYFQRLRRIEQNSCRAVYPSARHDRFIHSLGVFHIGKMIVEHLHKTCDVLPDNCQEVFDTYRLACLLHDVGHTPFSHTFEGFYNKDKLVEELAELIANDEFKDDIEHPLEDLTHHELISAWLGVKVFRDSIPNDFHINWNLFARMIIGLPFRTEKAKPKRDIFENIMIELIHGTIDADGLDYVCRDVWAGGYQNFSIDIDRLIDSIEVSKDGSDFVLSFSSKALSELETYINVKNFQYFYVINHHKVLLEQYYLVEGIKSAAVFHTGIADRDEAISAICNYKSFLNHEKLKSDFCLYQPCDDDFVSLMKQDTDQDTYIEEWFSRKHNLCPLWKSKIEFFQIFGSLFERAEEQAEEKIKEIEKDNSGVDADRKTELMKQALTRVAETLCGDRCIEFLTKELPDSSFYHKRVKHKIRRLKTKGITIHLNGKLIKLDDLKYDSFSVVGTNLDFCYIYINSDKFNQDSIEDKKQEIIDSLKNYVIDSLSL